MHTHLLHLCVQGTTDTEAVAFTGGTRFAKLGTFAWLAIAVSVVLLNT